MPIADFQSLMRPLLEAHADGKEHQNRDLVSEVKRIDSDYFVDT